MSHHTPAADALVRVASGAAHEVPDSARGDCLQLLLTRHSIGPKHLRAPAPSEDELKVIVSAALRAPDHGKLVPFRFVAIQGAGLERLAELFVDYGRRHGKTGDALAAERERATQAPLVLAVVARIDNAHADVPGHEQWATVGGAIANALTALHVLGYAGKMLSGARAGDPVLTEAFCQPGETLVGWISAGTATAPAKARGQVELVRVLTQF